jgi:peptidoglycan/LPS O-acetylase OafA/YrhL
VTGAGSGRRWLASIGAVLAGFLATVALSVVADVAMHAAGVFPAPGQPMEQSLFVLATFYRVLFTVAGGYLTARLAPDRPMAHAMVLAGLGLAGGLAGVVVWWKGGAAMGPAWYPIALVVTAVPCIWVGARLHLGARQAS